jgi:tRNA (guanine-N7-)-methyltransferase
MDAAAGFINTAGQGHYSPTRGNRCETKFERRGLKLGQGLWDLIYQKKL